MASNPERPQGLVFAKQAAAADVEGGGCRWLQQPVVVNKHGSRRLPTPTSVTDSLCHRLTIFGVKGYNLGKSARVRCFVL